MRTVGLSLAITIAFLAACSKQPVRHTSAVVIDIAPALSPRWDTDKVQVTARSLDGLIAVTNVSLAQLRCHVGDTVRASVQGMALTLEDGACIR